MKKLSCWLLVVIAFLIFAGAVNAGRYEEYIKTKKYKKQTEWKYEECTYCNGTGFVTKRKYDHARNRTKVIVMECPYCNGTGKVGISKK